MPTLARRQSWLTRPRLTGTPIRWSSHAGALGAAVGGLVPAALALPAFVSAYLRVPPFEYLWIQLGILGVLSALSGLVGGGLGAGVGLGVPAFLDRVRGRWPLGHIALAATATGAAVGVLSTGSWLALVLAVGVPPDTPTTVVVRMVPLVVAGGLGGAATATLWWAPFTVATVLGRRWPVTTAVAVGVPAAALLAMSLVFLV